MVSGWFSWFFSKMYPLKLYPGPTIQSRSAARRATQDPVNNKWIHNMHFVDDVSVAICTEQDLAQGWKKNTSMLLSCHACRFLHLCLTALTLNHKGNERMVMATPVMFVLIEGRYDHLILLVNDPRVDLNTHCWWYIVDDTEREVLVQLRCSASQAG